MRQQEAIDSRQGKSIQLRWGEVVSAKPEEAAEANFVQSSHHLILMNTVQFLKEAIS